MTTLPPPPPLAADAAVLLDFDGTLVPLAERHDAIRVDPGVRQLIRALAAALGGRVAVVSGRPVDQILHHLGANPAAPGFAVAGSHGLELLWPDGTREAPERPPALDRATAAAHAAAAGMPGVVVEDKPFGVALHYRQAPEHRPACDRLGDRLAADAGLQVQHGKMVCELRLPGADKGDATRRLLARPPLKSAAPLFVGDDLTDEAGFHAAEAAGGAGVLVGARANSAARYALPDVAAVLSWLGRAVG